MKSDHRHELKTNELADWLAHFPEWVKENRNTLLAGAVVLVVAVGVYFWVFYRRNVVATQTQIRLTNLVTQLPTQKAQIMQALSQGNDQSYVLLDVARDLQDFAQSTSDDRMAALALIDRAEAIRAELYYRLANVSREELGKQITQAQESYQQALQRGAKTPGLAAKAQFGLGLCEEELGNFARARQIYEEVVANADYDGTVAKAEADYRLTTMDDYKGKVVFKPAPVEQQAAGPTIQINPNDPGAPVVLPSPNMVTVTPSAVSPAVDSNAVPEPTAPVEAPETNQPAGS
jgi:tetratricopeptide (TPR) repeat protein